MDALGRYPIGRGIGGSGASSSGGGRGVSDLNLRKSSEVEWSTKKLPSDLPRSNPDVPPLFYVDVFGIVDTSHALPVRVDGKALKEFCHVSYQMLLEFASLCYQKCAHRLFNHPGGDHCVPGALVSLEGEMLTPRDFELAIMALAQYYRLSQVNLRLVNLLKVNFLLWAGELYYMTFSAYDENTGKTGTYQAALKSVSTLRNQDLPNTDVIGGYVLGLFIDCSTDMILACISIKDAEEDLAAKIKIYEDARAGVPPVRRF